MQNTLTQASSIFQASTRSSPFLEISDKKPTVISTHKNPLQIHKEVK